MSFLVFDEKSQIVSVKSEVKKLDYLVFLKDKKTSNKDFYVNSLKFIYHTYKKDHYFANLPINERKIKTSELYLGGQDIRQYDEDLDVQRLVKFYISLEYTQNEWTYQQLKNDIEKIKAHINEIPMSKTVKFNQEEEVECKCPKCGEKITVPVNFEKDIIADNTKERIEALRQIFTLQDMEEKFRDIIVREKKMKEHSQETTLLEQKYFDK